MAASADVLHGAASGSDAGSEVASENEDSFVQENAV